MTREQATALAQHAVSRSTIPTPLITRLALWHYRRTMYRPADDMRNAQTIRQVTK